MRYLLLLLLCSCKTDKLYDVYITNWATTSVEITVSPDINGDVMVSPWRILRQEGSIRKNTYRGQTCIESRELDNKIYRKELEKIVE